MEKVKPKKYLGQHFLTDRNIASAIVKALSAEDCGTVIEIGPGMGVLTTFLVERKFTDFRVIEVDRESVEYLKENVTGIGEIICGDFLELDLKSITSGNIGIIGNFPYNISSQIFFRIIENRDKVREVTCMIQKEVAERICTEPGSRVYGILSVFLQAWFDIEYLFTVSEKVFSPPPKVKSAVIRLKRNKTVSLGCNEDLFIKVVKTCFNQRRKMIRNPIKSLVSSKTDDFYLLSMRPEQLTIDQFVELTNWVESVK